MAWPRCPRCHKVSYPTHWEVRHAILIQWTLFPTRKLWFYPCPEDPAVWHMTSQDKPGSRR